MIGSRFRTSRSATGLLLLWAGFGGCASTGAPAPGATAGGVETRQSEPLTAGAAGSTTATLAGGRCQGGACKCRNRVGNSAEEPAPDEEHKRFEIRLAAEGGSAVLQSPTLGKFDGAGDNESCFYIDVIPGTTHDMTFFAAEGEKEGGVGPSLSIAEYGPKGPFWYDILTVSCAGSGRRCTREAADAWGAEMKTRKRGRIDPCGSAVVTRLHWETSGGTAERDSGLFRDLTVKWMMEVKKFPTQFPPRSTECIPK
jgi:hypothetical protein